MVKVEITSLTTVAGQKNALVFSDEAFLERVSRHMHAHGPEQLCRLGEVLEDVAAETTNLTSARIDATVLDCTIGVCWMKPGGGHVTYRSADLTKNGALLMLSESAAAVLDVTYMHDLDLMDAETVNEAAAGIWRMSSSYRAWLGLGNRVVIKGSTAVMETRIAQYMIDFLTDVNPVISTSVEHFME